MKNTLIIGVGVFLSKVISFFIVPMFSKWLTVEAYGTFDFTNTLISLMVPTVTLSIGEALFRFLIDANEKIERDQIISNCFLIYFCGWIVGIIIAIPICWHFLEFHIYIAFIFYLTAEIIYNFTMSLARGLKKTTLYANAGVYYILLLAISSLVLVKMLSYSLIGLLISYGIGFSIASVIILKKCNIKSFIKINHFSYIKIVSLIKYALPNIPNTISWWIMQASDRTVINTYIGSRYNGIYAVANYVPVICTTFFNAFHISWMQDISEKIKDKNSSEYINKIMNESTQSIISLCSLILSSTFLIFAFLFSKSYESGYPHAGILVFATLLSFLAQFLGGILVGMKKTLVLGTTTASAAIINIIIDLIFIDKIGLYAASISTLVCYIALYFERIYVLRKIVDIKYKLKTFILFLSFIYFFITFFINSIPLRYINLTISMFIFIFVNFNIIKTIIRRVI